MNTELLQLGFVFLTGFVITYFAIPSILEVAYKKNLFDVPDERKVHTRAIPSLGGVGIFMGVLLAFIIWSPSGSILGEKYKYILTGYLILFGSATNVMIKTAQEILILAAKTQSV